MKLRDRGIAVGAWAGVSSASTRFLPLTTVGVEGRCRPNPGTSASAAVAAPWPEFARQPDHHRRHRHLRGTAWAEDARGLRQLGSRRRGGCARGRLGGTPPARAVDGRWRERRRGPRVPNARARPRPRALATPAAGIWSVATARRRRRPRCLRTFRRVPGRNSRLPAWGDGRAGGSTERLPPPSRRSKGVLPLVVELGEPHRRAKRGDGSATRRRAPGIGWSPRPPRGRRGPRPVGRRWWTGLAERPCGTRGRLRGRTARTPPSRATRPRG